MNLLLKVYPSSKGIDIALFIARFSIGILMLIHGLPKLEAIFSGQPVQFISVFGLSPVISLLLAAFAEVFCSILLIVGFATRIAVVPLIITMLIALFVIHINDPFSRQEMPIHYLLVYSVLLFTGSGRYSLDYLMVKRNER